MLPVQRAQDYAVDPNVGQFQEKPIDKVRRGQRRASTDPVPVPPGQTVARDARTAVRDNIDTDAAPGTAPKGDRGTGKSRVRAKKADAAAAKGDTPPADASAPA
jgi:hypothetical protein